MKNYNFFREDLVRNKMNDTNLEYIAIYGLFGRDRMTPIQQCCNAIYSSVWLHTVRYI